MRYRQLSDAPLNRRRARSHMEGLDDASTYDDSTHDGLKAQHRITKREVSDLKRKWREEEDGTTGFVAVIDAGDGAVITGYSKQFLITQGGTFSEVTGKLEVAGSTDTITYVLLNGVTVATLTIPAGETSVTETLALSVAAGDYWQVQQATAGTGAIGPTYYGVFN